MPDTNTLIQKITVGSQSVSSISFTNIPQTYTDLLLIQSAMSNVSTSLAGNYNIEFNGITSGYSGIRIYADPGGSSSAFSDTGTPKWAGFIPGTGATQNVPNSCYIYIPNYTSSNYKSWSVDVVVENNGSNGYLGLGSNLWSNTSAITSFSLNSILSGANSGNFLQNSTFTLYGIAKEGINPSNTSAAYATGGDSITTDGTYWIHTFRSSGTFTPRKTLSNVDYLVVAGGGGGGGTIGGAGGAGGLRSTVTATGGGGSLETAFSAANGTAYTVTVGSGGSGGGSQTNGTQGNDSSISGTGLTTITSTGGGLGGSYNAKNGGSGGSGGGGGGGQGSAFGTGGTGTSNQGYAGANGRGSSDPNQFAGGGAGGAGAAGTNSNGYDVGGNGGAGVAVSITGSSVTYAGGGGGGANGSGGTAGSGGGGNGGNNSSTNAVAGTINRGGGGGGGGNGSTSNGAGGGSGIVIVRYPI